MLPPWFLKALLLARRPHRLIVLFLFVLKPAIESAASEAVASPLADLRYGVNAALATRACPR